MGEGGIFAKQVKGFSLPWRKFMDRYTNHNPTTFGLFTAIQVQIVYTFYSSLCLLITGVSDADNSTLILSSGTGNMTFTQIDVFKHSGVRVF